MNDLISRKKAIDYFVTNIGVVDADGYAVDDYDERVKAWTERFSGIPSAEPEERTAKAKVNFKDENFFFGWCECGQYQSSQHPYCPACGCRLEWE